MSLNEPDFDVTDERAESYVPETRKSQGTWRKSQKLEVEVKEQTDICQKLEVEIKHLKGTVQESKTDAAQQLFRLENIRQKPGLVKFYTGLPDFDTLMIFMRRYWTMMLK